MSLKHEGRPRDSSISRAIIQVAEQRMETLGFDKLTVDSIVNEVGTTRQAFYRRYKNMSVLALEILMARFGSHEGPDTGNLRNDLLALQLSDVAMMTTPLIQKNLPGLLEEIRTDPDTREVYLRRMILPRRTNVGIILERAKARKEISQENIDHEYLCDLLFGPLLSRVLLPVNLPIDEHLAHLTVGTVLNELKYSH